MWRGPPTSSVASRPCWKTAGTFSPIVDGRYGAAVAGGPRAAPGARPFRGDEPHRGLAGGGAQASGRGSAPRRRNRGEAAPGRAAARRRSREPLPTGHRRAFRRAVGAASRAACSGRRRPAPSRSGRVLLDRSFERAGRTWSRCGLPLRWKRCAPGSWRGSAPGSAGGDLGARKMVLVLEFDGPGGGTAADRGAGRARAAHRRTVARPPSRAPRSLRSGKRSGPGGARGGGGGALRSCGRFRTGGIVGTSRGPFRAPQRCAVSARLPASAGDGVRSRSGAGPEISPTSCCAGAKIGNFRACAASWPPRGESW